MMIGIFKNFLFTSLIQKKLANQFNFIKYTLSEQIL